jgi:hypothetical protein
MEAASCGDTSGISVGEEAMSDKSTVWGLTGGTDAVFGVINPLYAYTTPARVTSTIVVNATEMRVTLLFIKSSKDIG